MKKLISIIIGVATSLVTAQAQTNADNTEIKHDFITFYQNVVSNRSVSIAAYPSYAPDIVVNGKKDSFGLGLAALVPAAALPVLENNVVAQHAFVGLRFDYLAHEAFASTVGVGLRGDFQLWSHDFQVFAQTGANIPFSGFGLKNGAIGAMAGSGLYTTLWHPSANISLGIQLSAEKWTQFPGVVYHGGPVFNWTF
jgi:hypothetical protein